MPKKQKEVVSIALIWNNKVLMHLRDDKKGIAYPNHWSLPSGRIMQGETPSTAAIREFSEETNYNLSHPSPFHPLHKFINKSRVKNTYFFIEKYDEVQQIKCKEGQKMQFKSLNEIERLDKLVPGIYEVVKEIINAQ